MQHRATERSNEEDSELDKPCPRRNTKQNCPLEENTKNSLIQATKPQVYRHGVGKGNSASKLKA